jgi:hypothetical protein
MNRSNRMNAMVFVGLVGLGVLSRFLGVAPNFAAVSAIALFAGFFFSSRLVAVCVPVCAMLISDGVVGWYDGRVMAVVYASLLIPVLMRGWVRGERGATAMLTRAIGASMLCSVAFFLFTNLAVWGLQSIYSHDLAGLALCFERALPFFRFTLAGDVVFASALFGTYALATRSASAGQGVATAARA